MKRAMTIVVGLCLAMAAGSPAFAKKGGKPGGGGESQAGGLPALEDRVDADEALIKALQSAVNTLNSEVSTLNSEVADLQGQNNWAVVSSSGTVVRFSSAAGAVTASHIATGQYEVTFNEDVSG